MQLLQTCQCYKYISYKYVILQLMSEERVQYQRLKAGYRLLQEQRNDLRARVAELKKQLAIWSQINTEPNPVHKEKEVLLEKENNHLKTQMVCCLTEKQSLARLNEELQQKICDLKYNNGQLKSLNEKLTSLQTRELEVLRRNNLDLEQTHVKEKRALENRLENCSTIVKEMEEYYLKEIHCRNQSLTAKDKQIELLKEECRLLAAQYRQNKANQQYEKEISDLRSNVQFLVEKLQSMHQRDKQGIHEGSKEIINEWRSSIKNNNKENVTKEMVCSITLSSQNKSSVYGKLDSVPQEINTLKKSVGVVNSCNSSTRNGVNPLCNYNQRRGTVKTPIKRKPF